MSSYSAKERSMARFRPKPGVTLAAISSAVSVQPGRQQTCQPWSRVRDPASRDGSGRRGESQRRVHGVDRARRPTANGRYGTTRCTGYGSSSTSPSRHCPAINDPTTAVGCLDDRRCAAFGQPPHAAGLRIQQRVAPSLARRHGSRRTGIRTVELGNHSSRAGCRRCKRLAADRAVAESASTGVACGALTWSRLVIADSGRLLPS
jgi:hypothetical protein